MYKLRNCRNDDTGELIISRDGGVLIGDEHNELERGEFIFCNQDFDFDGVDSESGGWIICFTLGNCQLEQNIRNLLLSIQLLFKIQL